MTTYIPGVSGTYPSTRMFNLTATPSAQTNWATLGIGAYYMGARLSSSGAQNASLAVDGELVSGTYTFDLFCSTGGDCGIATVELADVAEDGTVGAFSELGTIDLYSASPGPEKKSLTGATVATSGRKRLRLRLATKNASSTNYFGRVSAAHFTRTAPLA